MDADVLWNEICQRLNQKSTLYHDDAWAILEMSENLRGWIVRNGFLPKVMIESGLNRAGAMRLLGALNDSLATY